MTPFPLGVAARGSAISTIQTRRFLSSFLFLFSRGNAIRNNEKDITWKAHGKHMESTWNGLKHRSIHPRPIITSRLVESITARIETVINLNSLERPCMLRHLLHKNDWIINCRCDPRDSIDGIRFISIIAAADERPRNDSPAGRPDSD